MDDRLKGALFLIGGIWAYSKLRSSTWGKEAGPDAEDLLNVENELRSLREKHWRIGADCSIEFKGSRDDDEPSTLAELILEDRDDFKEDIIYPAMALAYERGASTTEAVAEWILKIMFPGCDWPPPGNLAPECEWDGFSPFPKNCKWDAPDFENMLIWMTILGLVEESCSQEDAEGGLFGGGSGFVCATGPDGTKSIRPVE